MVLHVLLIEPYYGGSHRDWADNLRRFSRHEVTLLTLPAQFWKWRMQGGAVTLARLFAERDLRPDVILASDMFDLSTFCALTRQGTHGIPTALYFHENQLTYPQNSRQGHGWRYGFINYASALCADVIFFNSHYNLRSFFEQLPRMLRHFGDFNELQTVDQLRRRAQVLPPGVDLARFDAYQTPARQGGPPLIIWNHRWDEDKNPSGFFKALYRLADEGVPFNLVIAGENTLHNPAVFEAARERLGERVLHYGYIEDFAAYARWLWRADYVVSAAYQEFFGIAIIEAIHCDCVPLLPRRLNYPDLIPQEWHSACLYAEGGLYHLLRDHLLGQPAVDTGAIKSHVARYDWRRVIGLYDDALEALAAQS